MIDIEPGQWWECEDFDPCQVIERARPPLGDQRTTWVLRGPDGVDTYMTDGEVATGEWWRVYP